MRILILGGNGFIGSGIANHLQQQKHQVVYGISNSLRKKQLPENSEYRVINFCQHQDGTTWQTALHKIDAIINCAGILECTLEHMNRIHHTGPKALFHAAHQAGIKHLIHVSALGIEQSQCDFATTKLALDRCLLGSDVPVAIIRPSLVYDRNSYGGSALIRGLSGLPWLTPLPDGGTPQYQPIARDDLGRMVEHLLQQPRTGPHLCVAVGPDQLTLKQIIHHTQDWLRWPRSRVLSVPASLMRLMGRLGSFIGHRIINATAMEMTLQNNTASKTDTEHMMQSLPFRVKSFAEGLGQQASAVQDQWHARLYFIKPIARCLLATMWLVTAITTLINHQEISHQLLKEAHIDSPAWQAMWLYGGSAIDLLLGTLLLCNRFTKVVLQCQLGLVLLYTAMISLLAPIWWLNPLGPVVKNLPIIALTLILLAIEGER